MTDPNVIPFPGPGPATLADRDDDELMGLASAGRVDAFEALVRRHMPRLRGFCIKMTSDHRAGEDIAQDTWLKIWTRRRDYRGSGKFESFLYTVARNRCRNELRSSRRRGRLESDVFPAEESASDDPSHLDALLKQERLRVLQDEVGRLSPKFREVLLLRFSQGLDYAQISEVVGRSESTVRSRVFHGVRKLRRRMEGGSP